MKLWHLLCIWMLASSACLADDWVRAEIYYINWDVQTRARLTPAQVRRLASHKQTFTLQAPEVRQLLQLHRLRPSRDKHPEDPRVVIDYIDDDAKQRTLYLSRFSLCTTDHKHKFAIDDKFRQRISALALRRQFPRGT